MRKKDETLRDTLLDIAREIANDTGPESINIRALAKQAGVASGTVYNYFASKDDILLALTEEYWRATLEEMQENVHGGDFTTQLSQIYSFLQGKIANSGKLLMLSLRNVEPRGQKHMQSMLQVLRLDIIRRMRMDAHITQEAWNENLTEEYFADYVYRNMVMLLRTGAPDIAPFIEIVQRVIY